MKMIKKISVVLFAVLVSCGNDSPSGDEKEPVVIFEIKALNGSQFIANHAVAKEEVLRAIPKKYIDVARQNLHVAYQHTSHGTHVTYGLYGLQDYKDGDKMKFAVTENNPKNNKLDLRDYAMKNYADNGEDASDLSRNETAFVQATRNYLDDVTNQEINVVMWAWCDIKGHNVEENYLPGMKILISEYGIGGTKIGDGNRQKRTPVHFIFMTGHANKNANEGEGNPANQAKLIIDFCKTNKFMCFDYYGIDSHCMNGNYWPDASDDGYSVLYNGGGNFYLDWQKSKKRGVDYYENKISPNGVVRFGEHNTQHITANRKAYAMWWIMARLSGWDGESSD